MPHGQMTLAGPGIYAGGAVALVAVLAAIWMTVNALRRPRYHFGKLGPWGYVGFALVYVVLILGMVFIRVSGIGAAIAGQLFLAFALFSILMIIVAIIYLLGVVFPDEKSCERRAQFEAEHNITPAKKRPKKDAGNKPAIPTDTRADGEFFDD